MSIRDEKWQEAVRRDPVYLPGNVWKACWLIAKWRSGKLDDQGLSTTTTADQIAAELLRGAIKEQYPWLIELQKDQSKLEDEALEKLSDYEKGKRH